MSLLRWQNAILSVCSNAPTLYPTANLSSALAMRGALHGEARRGLPGQGKAFLVQDQVLQMLQVPSASNWRVTGEAKAFKSADSWDSVANLLAFCTFEERVLRQNKGN